MRKEATQQEKSKDELAMARIHRAFAGMPYGGMCHFQFENLDLEAIASNLESLQETLRQISTDHERLQKESIDNRDMFKQLNRFFALVQNASEKPR